MTRLNVPYLSIDTLRAGRDQDLYKQTKQSYKSHHAFHRKLAKTEVVLLVNREMLEGIKSEHTALNLQPHTNPMHDDYRE